MNSQNVSLNQKFIFNSFFWNQVMVNFEIHFVAWQKADQRQKMGNYFKFSRIS